MSLGRHQLTQEELTKVNANFETASISRENPKEYSEEVINSLGYILVTDEAKNLIETENGPLVTTAPTPVLSDNGLYIFKEEDGAYLLEVIVPNTVDRTPYITSVTQRIDNAMAQIPLVDLQVYDLVQIYMHVIVNNVIKPLAVQLFPTDPVKQEKVVTYYLPKFLANVARYHVGDTDLKEESVNGELYLLKLLIDKETELARGKDNDK